MSESDLCCPFFPGVVNQVSWERLITSATTALGTT